MNLSYKPSVQHDIAIKRWKSISRALIGVTTLLCSALTLKVWYNHHCVAPHLQHTAFLQEEINHIKQQKQQLATTIKKQSEQLACLTNPSPSMQQCLVYLSTIAELLPNTVRLTNFTYTNENEIIIAGEAHSTQESMQFMRRLHEHPLTQQSMLTSLQPLHETDLVTFRVIVHIPTHE